jgi:hypothetical protein
VELIHQLVRSGTYNVPDLLDDIQVRLIGVNHYGLRVYPQHDGKGDEPHWKVVGVVIERGDERKPPWRIPGWIYARDARRKEWLIDPHDRKAPMWAVPQEFLRDPMELSKKRRPLIPPKPKYNPTLQPPPKPVAPPRAKFQLRGVKVSSEARCPVCYQVGGKFERVTYTDAPLGGLPVHTDCIVDFFTHMIDGQGGLI